AQAREREADVQRDPKRAAAALVEAANVYRAHLSDREKAKACFGRAYTLDAESQGALIGLAQIAEEDERWEVAYALSMKRLPLAVLPHDRAEALHALARATRAQPNALEEARSFLEEAVAIAPDYLPATLALADLDLASERLTDAERLLERVLGMGQSDPE